MQKGAFRLVQKRESVRHSKSYFPRQGSPASPLVSLELQRFLSSDCGAANAKDLRFRTLDSAGRPESFYQHIDERYS